MKRRIRKKVRRETNLEVKEKPISIVRVSELEHVDDSDFGGRGAEHDGHGVRTHLLQI